MTPTIAIFPTGADSARAVAENLRLKSWAKTAKGLPFTLAISGGNTPKSLFAFLKSQPKDYLPWHNILIFWADERCVPAESPDSNYGEALRGFLADSPIPKENIIPVNGSNDPENEAVHYSALIKEKLPCTNGGIPQFDLILLGAGADGHTASLFEGKHWGDKHEICIAAQHPMSGQKRVSLSMGAINAAGSVYFLAVGADKSQIIYEIFKQKPNFARYPAGQVSPFAGECIWFSDRAATAKL